MEKMTYIVALNCAIACEALPAEVREKLTALRDTQEKRTHATHKPTAKQVANVDYRQDIYDAMEVGKQYTITDLMTAVPSIAKDGLSNQRVSALVRQLKDAGLVSRSAVKSVAYFSKVAE